MTVLDPAHEAAHVEIAPPSGVTARVTTTVVLPPDALTVVVPHPEMISQINVEQVLGIPCAHLPRAPARARPARSPSPTSASSDSSTATSFRGWLEARGKAKRAAVAIERPRDDDDLLTVEEQVRLGIKPAPRPRPGRR